MTDVDSTPAHLRFAVATEFPLAEWQARCVDALTGVTGVTVQRWIKVEPGPMSHAGTGRVAFARAVTPPGLTRLEPDAGQVVAGPAPSTDDHVDVLLDLTRTGVPAAGRWAAETWRFRYGSGLSTDPIRAALVDFIRTPGQTHAVLATDPGRRVLREGWLSWTRGEQLDRILLDTTDWPATVALDRTSPSDGAEPGQAMPGSAGTTGRPPGARSRAVAAVPRRALRAAATTRRVLRVADTVLRHDDWRIGVIEAPIREVVDAAGRLPIRWLAASNGRFAADPFGLERDGVLHVFFEEYDHALSRGIISHLAIAADGTASEPEAVLDAGVHASYPFVVEDGGSTFLLPETAAAGRLTLYEAVEFPRRWRPAATLLDGVPAVDATIVQHDGRWWLFATRLDRGANHNLFVWHAPELLGPWTAHQANPVKTDARSARPGGTPYAHDGRLFRPAQDDSFAYGGRIVVNEVDVLTPRLFHERSIQVVAPEPGSPFPDGLHTLSAAAGRTLIDGNRRRFVRKQFIHDMWLLVESLRSGRGS